MNINATLIGQAIAFAIFVLFCMKFVWPPVIAALHERQKKIADGLDAANRAARDLELAHEKAGQQLREAKAQALAEIEQELNSAKDALRAQVGALAVSGAEKILGASIDANAQKQLVDQLAAEI